jgi:hypothetical protein
VYILEVIDTAYKTRPGDVFHKSAGWRLPLLCAVTIAVGGCHIATQQELQERYLEQMAAQDDAYCKQQTSQSYDACRSTRVAYRQTMMLGATSEAQASMARQQAANAMCQLSSRCW